MGARSIALLGSTCSGHGCFPPRVSLTGSSFFFINGTPVHAVGDAWAIHTCTTQAHAGVLAEGSSLMYVNGKPIGRVGDAIDCGSVVAEGSDFVFVNG